jgi:hypothetical protein
MKNKWEIEGDSKDFEAFGLKCHIRRHKGMGHLCGYVRVDKDHKLYGKNYSEALCGHTGCILHTVENIIVVHGGITYSGKAYWDEKDEGWWFGFDCGHSDDICPYLPTNFEGATYKDMEFVTKECKKLAYQLKNWEKFFPILKALEVKKDEDDC